MRRFIAVLGMTAVVLGGTQVALADEPEGGSGSTFDGSQVTCGHTNTFLDSPIVVYNNGKGAEVCSDELPVQGRVILNHPPGTFLGLDYLHIDGDADNPEPLPQGHVAHVPLPLVLPLP